MPGVWVLVGMTSRARGSLSFASCFPLRAGRQGKRVGGGRGGRLYIYRLPSRPGPVVHRWAVHAPRQNRDKYVTGPTSSVTFFLLLFFPPGSSKRRSLFGLCLPCRLRTPCVCVRRRRCDPVGRRGRCWVDADAAAPRLGSGRWVAASRRARCTNGGAALIGRSVG